MLTRLFAAMLFVWLLTAPAVAAEPFHHPGGLHAQQGFDRARKLVAEKKQPTLAAYEQLLRAARKGLEREPEPVEWFNPPGYYGNPKKCLEILRHLSHDAWAAYACAVAWQLAPGAERADFADKTVAILAAWTEGNKGWRGSEGSLLMSYAGMGFICAAEAISNYDGWTDEQRSEFRTWVRTIYLKACTAIAGRGNNWGDWGVMGSIAAHYFLDDAKALDADIKRIRHKIDRAIAADGHMPAETRRGYQGIWYTYFALAPLTAACRIAQNARGVDLFHSTGKDGASIERALDYLLTYCHEPATWPHYKGKKLNLPKPTRWPGNLFEAMAVIYKKPAYAAYVKDARPLMVVGHHYAWAIPTLLPPVIEEPKPDEQAPPSAEP